MGKHIKANKQPRSNVIESRRNFFDKQTFAHVRMKHKCKFSSHERKPQYRQDGLCRQPYIISMSVILENMSSFLVTVSYKDILYNIYFIFLHISTLPPLPLSFDVGKCMFSCTIHFPT